MEGKLAVIIPDKISGEDFQESLEANGIKTESILADITPRVVRDGTGHHIINPRIGKVSLDLANVILDTTARGFTQITFACNTVSLDLFVKPALEVLSELGLQHGVHFRLLTSLRSLVIAYDFKIADIPLFLGTTPICYELERPGFKTLLSEDRLLQSLTQEVIWRTKAIYGMDHSTAGPYRPKLTNKRAYENALESFIIQLNSLHFDKLILGCTELPLALKDATKLGLELNKQLINPADILAQTIHSGKFSSSPSFSLNKPTPHISQRAYLNNIALIQ